MHDKQPMDAAGFFAEAKRLNLRAPMSHAEMCAAFDAKDAEIADLRAQVSRLQAGGEHPTKVGTRGGYTNHVTVHDLGPANNPDDVIRAKLISMGWRPPAAPALVPLKPDRTGIYAWVSGTSCALVLVNKRPSDHAPGGQFNGHVIDSTRFYDGCAVTSWGRDGTWMLLHDFGAKLNGLTVGGGRGG